MSESTVLREAEIQNIIKDYLDDKLYDTGWVSCSDWTDADLTITHNLDANIGDLMIKFLISTDGTDNNSIEPNLGTFNNTDDVAAYYGAAAYQDSKNAFHIQTGYSGIWFPRDLDGASTYQVAQSHFYKVKVFKLI